MAESDWGKGVHGASAGLNSTRLYTCSTCSGCVIDFDGVPYPMSNRASHDEWHAPAPDDQETEGDHG